MPTTIPTELIAPLFNPATFGVRGAVDTLLTRVRSEYPLSIAEVPGFEPHWIVTRHADVVEISRRNDVFANAVRSATLITTAGEDLVKQYTGGDPNLFHSLVQMDGAEHKAHRELTLRAFTPKSLETIEATVRTSARKHLGRLREAGGRIDWAKDIAAQYPLEVVLNIVGVPEADHPKMLRLTQWLFSWADPDLARPGSDPTDLAQQARSWKIIFDEFSDYYLALMDERRKHPRDDIASVIANAVIDGEPITDWNAVSYFGILSTAGHDSSAHTMATAMWELAENPQLLDELKYGQDKIMPMVNESIRWATPVKHFVRTATEDTEVGGRRIARGDRLYLSYPSANRDEAEFPNPFEFRLDRNRNRQLAFGFGGHACLGQHLARLEMKCLWEELLPQLKSVCMDGEGQLICSEFVSGPKSVPIRYELV
jgi:cytochrome P450